MIILKKHKIFEWTLTSKFQILPFPYQYYTSFLKTMKDTVVFAIDIGGTKISGAIFNSSGQILSRKSALINQLEGQKVGDLVIKVIDQLQTVSNNLSLKVKAVGIAIPGIFNAQEGTVWAPNIPGWESYPLHDQIRRHLSEEIVIKIDNDRACYILGETWKGAAVGCEHAIFLAVGTGIGAGILVNGSVLRGKNDIAGAIGWMALTDKLIPPYSIHGCFEHHASGNGIAAIAQQNYDRIGTDTGNITSEQVFEAFGENDPVAVKTVQSAIEFWGKAVANLVSLFNPEKIIFGGGVFGPASKFLNDIQYQAAKWAQPISMKQAQLVISELGSEAGLYGAGYLVKDYLHKENE